MPPGSAEALPPSNAKPYTPSLSNGVRKPAREGATSLTSSLAPAPASSNTISGLNNSISAPTDPDQPQPSAPKPLKKRYLAAAEPSSGAHAQNSSLSPGSGSGGTAPPSPSVGDQIGGRSGGHNGVSPEAARSEAAACEALMELSRTGPLSSEAGPRTSSRSSDVSSSGSETRSRGSPSDSQPLQSLREKVWSKVATNILKQVDESQEPPKDSPMNLSASAPAPVSQCTIRGQQIIEHIIENILDKPMEGQPCVPCEPINVSVNNNQEEGIKASIYESLKNDLLKGKTPLMMTSSKSAPTTPPGGARLTPPTVSATNGGQNGGQPKSSLPVNKPCPLPPLVPIPQAAKLAPGAVHKMTSVTNTVSSHSAPNSATPSPSASSASSSSTPATHSPNSITPPGHQDVLRLLARSSQLPINVGHSSITITKTPRTSQPHHVPSTVASVASTPVSVSLTRTGSNQVFNLGAAMTPGGSGSVTSIAGVPMVLTSQPGMVLTTGGHAPSSVVLTGLAGHGGQPGECVLLSPAAASSNTISGLNNSISGPGVILQQAMGGAVGGALHGGQVVIAPASGQPLLIPPGSKLILANPVAPGSSGPRPGPNSHNSACATPVSLDNSDPVNLTVAKLRPHPEAGNSREAASNNLLSVSPGLATLKRPASLSDGDEEDIRRSSRQSKGKRYQEFIEDGRLNVNSRPKRRSHRSGEDEEDAAEPLTHEDSKLTLEATTQSSGGMNHWKKKLRTVSLGETQTSAASSERLHHLGGKVSLTREPEPESAHVRLSHAPRATRNHAHHAPYPASAPGRGAFDVKLGNKKIRGEKISH